MSDDARITWATIAIVLTLVGLALSAYGRAKNAPGARESWPSTVLGAAAAILLALTLVMPALLPDGRGRSSLQWGLLTVALCFTAVDLWMQWKRWKAAPSGARMSE